jgi:DNA end-binding protein Ku
LRGLGTGEAQAVARSLWSGSISFGLVNVPVRLYPAISEHKLHFHLVHEKDSSPIGYEKVCKAEDKPVPADEIVKAFEYSKGKYVFMEDEDFEQARVEGYKTIDILDFVPYEEIDPIFFAKTYYAGPDSGAERVYALLVRAMKDSGLAGIAKFVMREQQHLGALRVREDLLTLEQLHFADEIRPVDELRPSGQRVDKQELAMASKLIESFKGHWKPERYEDTYRDQLRAVIEAKRKGKEVHRAAEVEEEAPADLLDALRASIQRSRGGARAKTNGRSRNGSLDGLSKAELEQRARKAGIEGRSKMTKDELVEALRAA